MSTPPTAKNPESWATLALGHGVPRRSLLVALVVGTILNVINQSDVLWGNADIDSLKLGLTYAVPYLVATYGAVTAYRRLARRR
jgi:hypothetical protein